MQPVGDLVIGVGVTDKSIIAPGGRVGACCARCLTIPVRHGLPATLRQHQSINLQTRATGFGRKLGWAAPALCRLFPFGCQHDVLPLLPSHFECCVLEIDSGQMANHSGRSLTLPRAQTWDPDLREVGVASTFASRFNCLGSRGEVGVSLRVMG